MRTADAVRHFGSQTAVAEALGMKSQSSVSTWGEYPPALRQLQLERVTGGKLRAEPDCDDFRVPVRADSDAPVASNGDEGQPHTALSMGEDARSPERDDSPEADESYARWRAKRSEKPQ